VYWVFKAGKWYENDPNNKSLWPGCLRIFNFSRIIFSKMQEKVFRRLAERFRGLPAEVSAQTGVSIDFFMF